jgi:hypothetical protein
MERTIEHDYMLGNDSILHGLCQQKLFLY